MFWQYLLLILFLSPSLYGANTSIVPSQNASRAEAFERASPEVKRDPGRLAQTLAARLQQPYSDRLQEIADLALHASALAELGDIDHLQKSENSLQKALDEAMAAAFYPPALNLLLVQAYILENRRQTVESRARYERVIALAREHNLPNYQLQALYEYSFALQDEGLLQEGLQKQNEANQLVIDRPDIDPLEKHIFWAQNAMSLHFSGSYPEAEQLYNQSLKYFAEQKLDFLLATYLYNRGTMYADWNHENTRELALKDFEKALVLARKLSHEPLQGSILASLAGLHNVLGAYDLGLIEVREALTIFQRSKDYLWQANLWRRMAALHLGNQNWTEVEKAAKQALTFYQDPDSIDRSLLYEMLAKAAAATSDFRAAYTALKEHQRLEAKKNAEKSSDNFARERVKMGLLVEEQKNALLQKDNELKEQKIQASRWILTLASGVSVLLLFTLLLLFLLQKKSREIEVRKDRMDRILSNIEDAIITLDHQLNIEPEYSAFTETLLGGRLHGRHGLELLQKSMGLTEHDRILIEETLRACLGEDGLTWEFNAGHLPIELQLPDRAVAVQWQAFYSKQKLITGFLLSMRDVTQRRQLEAQLKTAEIESQGLQIKLKELLATDRSAVGQLIGEIQMSLLDTDRSPAFARRVHTLKGNARTLQLKALASTLHQWEEGFHDEPAQQLRKHCEQYENLLKDMRGTSVVFAGGLLQIVARLSLDLKKQLESRSPLKLQLEVIDTVLDWPATRQADLQAILLHACTNAIDHGFLEGGALPTEKALLRIEACRKVEGLRISIQDNGRGLAWEQLTQLANSRGFVPGAEESLADVVFLDQVSTTSAVSTTSGRGVGLAAIKEIVKRWGGTVKLQDHPTGQGSQLLIQSPWITEIG